MEHFNLNQKYVLNPAYRLYPDKNRIILTNTGVYDFFIAVHPMYAVMLSFFNGAKTLDDTIDDIASFFTISKDTAYAKIQPFIENATPVHVDYAGGYFYFPKEILVKQESDDIRSDLKKESLAILPPYDFKTIRLNSPKNMLLVLNMQCVTDCIYCYADRKTPFTPMALQQILAIIDDAVRIDVFNINISGGDIFLHKEWDKILKKLFDCGYQPLVSTKLPLTKEMIDRAWDTGLRDIQISIDSLKPELLMKTLNVPYEYADKIKTTILALDEKGFSITLKSTVTKDTCTVENISEVLEFAKQLKNIKRYTFTPLAYSQNKSIDEFNRIKPTIAQTGDITELLNGHKDLVNFELHDDNSSVTNGSECCNSESFVNRSLCSANAQGIIVLPDGKVTICEELYWNPNFLLGDLTQTSIMDMWLSDKAVNLSKMNQQDFPEASACKTCTEFESCRSGLGVCWKRIIAAYGKENWLYPDYKCPKAPKPINRVFYDNSFIETI